MKRMKRAIAMLAACCLLLFAGLTAFAAEDATPAVAKAREGVIQVKLYYVDKSGNEYALKAGSGFLVGASTGATTVITNYHVITIPDHVDGDGWDKEKLSEKFGVDFFNSNEINLKIKAVVKRDVEIDASYVNGSEKTDFAILELQQAIYDRVPLQLADSDKVVETQNIYALGFPDAASNVQDDSVFTSEDVTITNGIVGKFQDISNIRFILHNAKLGYGNSGGPLVDSNGNIVGVNTLFYGDESGNYYSSIAVNEVAGVLDALGITYEKADGASGEVTQPEEPKAPEQTVPTVTAPAVPEQTAPAETEASVPEAEQPSETAEPEMVEPETGMDLKVVGIAAAVIVVAVIAAIAVVMASKSKKKKTMPVGQIPNAPISPAVPPRPTPPPFPTPNPMTPMDTGAGETSVLGGGAGETSVLGGAGTLPAATLIRRKNGETSRINKPSFLIGKERQKVDFCIPDNNSISRIHADIVCRGGVYYLIDKNSTNYTFVNGNKISPNQEVKLNSGDKIKLADEEFEFRL